MVLPSSLLLFTVVRGPFTRIFLGIRTLKLSKAKIIELLNKGPKAEIRVRTELNVILLAA